MSECTTKEEFETKFAKNTRYFGRGFETGMSIPCAFCAEPDFMTYKLVEMRDGDLINCAEEAMLKGAVCKHCGRGLRAIFMHDNSNPHRKLTRFEIVQFCGPDGPDFVPKLKRVEQ